MSSSSSTSAVGKTAADKTSSSSSPAMDAAAERQKRKTTTQETTKKTAEDEVEEGGEEEEDPLVIDETDDVISGDVVIAAAAKSADNAKESGDASAVSGSAAAASGNYGDGGDSDNKTSGLTSRANSEEDLDNEDEEKEFEPTIDMMINDFDDEQTMDEEEALEGENAEDAAAEAEALEQEADMPLEELLKMYGYNKNPQDEEEDEEDEEGEDEEGEGGVKTPRKKDEGKRPSLSPKAGDKRSLDDSGSEVTASGGGDKKASTSSGDLDKRGSMSPPPPVKKSKSELARFYEATVEGRSLRSSGPGGEGGGGGGGGGSGGSGSGGQEDDDDDDDENAIEDSAADDDETGSNSGNGNRDFSWKKTIMIGPSFQASVPNDIAHYGDTLPYENEDKLLWDPSPLTHEDVVEYLAKAQETPAMSSSNAGGMINLPMGAHVRDDEQVLYLLHQCGNNYSEALRRRRMNSTPAADTMSLWSEEECRSFELGLRLYGKDFHMIQQQKVRTRSVGELVQFYYLWKKTERHDVFANATRLEKKKYTLHPGTTDYMDRFIDEQDPTRDLSASPNYHSLLYGTDTKRSHGLTLHPSGNSSHARRALEADLAEAGGGGSGNGITNGDRGGVNSGGGVTTVASLVNNGSSSNHPEVGVVEPRLQQQQQRGPSSPTMHHQT